jgi:diphosphomevalonate decarboxylase
MIIYNENDFKINKYCKKPIEGTIHAKGNANIAIIKYWGKHKNQLPTNPSISFTLNNCYTTTYINFTPKKTQDLMIDFFFNKKKNLLFQNKIYNFFKKIQLYCPYINDYKFIIKSNNNFPHSTGIASSASFISSLSMCIIQLEKKLTYITEQNDKYFKKASFISRLGSGSACRSIYTGWSIWGNTHNIAGSNDLYAIPYPKNMINKFFIEYNDTILIINSTPKQTSSSQGHLLMNNNPYAKVKYRIARKNINKLIQAMYDGNDSVFGSIAEEESLNLHAMLLSSNPYIILFRPNTIQAILDIIKFRRKNNCNIFFSLDAGCNVHILYHNKEADMVQYLIQQKLLHLCEQGKYIHNKCNY